MNWYAHFCTYQTMHLVEVIQLGSPVVQYLLSYEKEGSLSIARVANGPQPTCPDAKITISTDIFAVPQA